MTCRLLPIFPALLLFASHGTADDPKPADWLKPTLAAVDAKLDAEVADLLALYKHLHANPELSLQEMKSAARMAEELRKLGFDVTEKVGGTGVVGVLKNGAGPTVLVRADMDALPVTEQTGVPYASKVRTTDRFGHDVGVMHACGHDVHMTCFVGTARVLASVKDRWAGTLVFVAQPAEEIGVGARAMIEDGLFKRFPKPDYALALHADALAEVGTIRFTDGLALANVDTVDVTVKGRGGHGASPHTTVDPIVLAARIVLDLQTIVSREVNPTDPAVVTVGSIHGGTKHNIIPNEVKLQITVRSTKDAVRDHVLKAIDRICKAAAAGARAPDPEVRVNLAEYTPSTINDGPLTRRTVADHGRRGLRPVRPGRRAELHLLPGHDPVRPVRGGAAGGRPAAPVDALGPVRPRPGAERPHRGADDEHGRAEPTHKEVGCYPPKLVSERAFPNGTGGFPLPPAPGSPQTSDREGDRRSAGVVLQRTAGIRPTVLRSGRRRGMLFGIASQIERGSATAATVNRPHFEGWHLLGAFPDDAPNDVGSWLLVNYGEALLLEIPRSVRQAGEGGP
jgi:amidohydrolase